MSPKYQLNKSDAWKIVKVLLWSGLSAIVASAILLVEQVDVPTQYAFAVPVVNVILYTAQRFLAGK